MKKTFLSLFILLAVLSFSRAQVFTKKVLLEEMTTTLCSFCPYKSADLIKFVGIHPNAIAVAHHAGFGQDAMTCQPASDFAAAFSPYHFPSMTIDRIKFDSVPGYYTKYVGVSMMAFKWEDSATSVLNNITAIAKVTITKNWDPSLRKVTGNVTVTFNAIPESGDLRINLYVLEDSVVGDTGAYKYDQKNNHTNDMNYPELYGKTLIPGYAHRNVVRAAPLGSWGAPGIIPAIPALSTDYSAPFSYTIPEKYDTVRGHDVDPRNIKLVGFVSYYNSDTWKRRVLNCEEVNLTDGTSGVPENGSYVFSVYPNPADGLANVAFKLEKNSDVNVALYDLNGRMIKTFLNRNLQSGSYSLDINLGQITNGNYILKLNTDGASVNKKIVIIH